TCPRSPPHGLDWAPALEWHRNGTIFVLDFWAAASRPTSPRSERIAVPARVIWGRLIPGILAHSKRLQSIRSCGASHSWWTVMCATTGCVTFLSDRSTRSRLLYQSDNRVMEQP